jgi:hypothetical protein
MNIAQAKNVLSLTIAADTPLWQWGAPGVGKSDIVRQVADTMYADEYGYTVNPDGTLTDPDGNVTKDRPYLIDLRASLLDPVDLMGLPVPDNGSAKWLRPSFLPPDNWRGIIHFDELAFAAPAVQAACLQWILDRRCGPHRLPPGARMVASSNRPEDRAGVRMPIAPLLARFVHIEIEPELKGWQQWAQDNGVREDIRDFLKDRPSHLLAPPADNGKDKVGPNPRGWHTLSRLYDAAESANVTMLTATVAGVVGSGVAAEYIQWRRQRLSFPSAGTIRKNPYSVKLPKRIDELAALGEYLAALVKEDNDLIDPVSVYTVRMPAEQAAAAIRSIAAECADFLNTPAVNKWLETHADLITGETS